MKKNLTFLFIALAVACQPKDNKTSITTEIAFDQHVIDELCAIPLTKNTGKFITSQEAAKKLEEYKKFRTSQDSGYNAKNDIYGFVFGVERMRALLRSIDEYNAGVTSKDSLIGMRIYLARAIESTTKKEIPDVFIVPVKADKKNAVWIDEISDGSPFITKDSLILNSSLPCPTICSKKVIQ